MQAKWTTTSIDKDVHFKLKIYCANRSLVIGDFVTEAVLEKLAKEYAKAEKEQEQEKKQEPINP